MNSFILFTQKAPNGWKVFTAISLIGLVYPCKKKKISIWGKEFWADRRLFWTYATICLQDKANFCYKWTNPGRYVLKIFVKLYMRFFHKFPSNSEFAKSFLLVLLCLKEKVNFLIQLNKLYCRVRNKHTPRLLFFFLLFSRGYGP